MRSATTLWAGTILAYIDRNCSTKFAMKQIASGHEPALNMPSFNSGLSDKKHGSTSYKFLVNLPHGKHTAHRTWHSNVTAEDRV